MAVDNQKHEVPAGGDGFNRSWFTKLSDSINGFITVASATERDQVIARLVTAGKGPTTARPRVFWRSDMQGFEHALGGGKFVAQWREEHPLVLHSFYRGEAYVYAQQGRVYLEGAVKGALQLAIQAGSTYQLATIPLHLAPKIDPLFFPVVSKMTPGVVTVGTNGNLVYQVQYTGAFAVGEDVMHLSHISWDQR